MSYKYGLLKSSSLNLGNEIQNVATRPFLPRVDVNLDIDFLSNFKSDQRVKLITAGCFLARPTHWPPSSDIEPLFVSFHVEEYARKLLTSEESVRYFKRHEPIGCRDYFTRDLLRQKGIKTYFSGCITLTLKRSEEIQRTDEILLTDLDERVMQYLPSRILAKSTILHHDSGIPIEGIASKLHTYSPLLHKIVRATKMHRVVGNLQIEILRHRSSAQTAQRCAAAEELLIRYAQARLVITSRLHGALPCLAFGTPVIFVPRNVKDPRFSGLVEYMRSYSIEEFEHVAKSIDPENPEPNPRSINELRENLTRTCNEFVSREMK